MLDDKSLTQVDIIRVIKVIKVLFDTYRLTSSSDYVHVSSLLVNISSWLVVSLIVWVRNGRVWAAGKHNSARDSGWVVAEMVFSWQHQIRQVVFAVTWNHADLQQMRKRSADLLAGQGQDTHCSMVRPQRLHVGHSLDRKRWYLSVQQKSENQDVNQHSSLDLGSIVAD